MSKVSFPYNQTMSFISILIWLLPSLLILIMFLMGLEIIRSPFNFQNNTLFWASPLAIFICFTLAFSSALDMRRDFRLLVHQDGLVRWYSLFCKLNQKCTDDDALLFHQKGSQNAMLFDVFLKNKSGTKKIIHNLSTEAENIKAVSEFRFVRFEYLSSEDHF